MGLVPNMVSIVSIVSILYEMYLLLYLLYLLLFLKLQNQTGTYITHEIVGTPCAITMNFV